MTLKELVAILTSSEHYQNGEAGTTGVYVCMKDINGVVVHAEFGREEKGPYVVLEADAED